MGWLRNRAAELVLGAGLATSAVAGAVAAPSPVPEIPDRAYQAYITAAAHEVNTCAVPWYDLAAIGFKESNHGRFGGRHIDPDGKMTPALVVWDVKDYGGGPMGFLELTWFGRSRSGHMRGPAYAVDGDGDGELDPQDIDDVAASAVNLLCNGKNYGANRWLAIRRYNGSGPKAARYEAHARQLSAKYQKAQPNPTGGLAPGAVATGLATSAGSGGGSHGSITLGAVDAGATWLIDQWDDLGVATGTEETPILNRAWTTTNGPVSHVVAAANAQAGGSGQTTTPTPSADLEDAGDGRVKVRTKSDLYRTIEVDASVGDKVQALIDAAWDEDNLVLTGSGWRSTKRQAELYQQNCGGGTRPCSPPTAPPGSSQHELGLAIDFKNCSYRGTRCYRWLAQNAERFGFYNLPSEPWHWSTTGK